MARHVVFAGWSFLSFHERIYPVVERVPWDEHSGTTGNPLFAMKPILSHGR